MGKNRIDSSGLLEMFCFPEFLFKFYKLDFRKRVELHKIILLFNKLFCVIFGRQLFARGFFNHFIP